VLKIVFDQDHFLKHRGVTSFFRKKLDENSLVASCFSSPIFLFSTQTNSRNKARPRERK